MEIGDFAITIWREIDEMIAGMLRCGDDLT